MVSQQAVLAIHEKLQQRSPSPHELWQVFEAESQVSQSPVQSDSSQHCSGSIQVALATQHCWFVLQPNTRSHWFSMHS